MKKYILILMVGISIISCSKDERIERQIKGSWTISEVFIVDDEDSYWDTTYYDCGQFNFDNSSKKYDCWIIADEDMAKSEGYYSITDKGKYINFTGGVLGESSTLKKFNISEYDKKNTLVFTGQDSDGVLYQFKLKPE